MDMELRRLNNSTRRPIEDGFECFYEKVIKVKADEHFGCG